MPREWILDVDGVSKSFTLRRHLTKPNDVLNAVVDVTLQVAPGESVGIVGESGSGKTTLARVIVRLLKPDRGRVLFEGADLTRLRGSALRAARRRLQMVFQDPYSSLHPRMRIGDAIEEPLRFHRVVEKSRVRGERDSLMDRVGLSTRLAGRLPRELSGGQRQRVSIARALSVRPALLVADEPVSSLDVSVRAQILNLLSDLREGLDLTLLFISHDLSVIDHLASRVVVMYFGRIVELGSVDDVIGGSAHPYTRALVAAIPQPVVGSSRRGPVIRGEQPSAINPPSGCVFRTRCPIAQAICAEVEPPHVTVAPGHSAACHFAKEVVSGMTPAVAAESIPRPILGMHPNA